MELWFVLRGWLPFEHLLHQQLLYELVFLFQSLGKLLVLIVGRPNLPVLILNHLDDLLLVLDELVNFLDPVVIV